MTLIRNGSASALAADEMLTRSVWWSIQRSSGSVAPPKGVDERVAAPTVVCLEADPGQRPAAVELADAFEAILGELPRPRARRRTR